MSKHSDIFSINHGVPTNNINTQSVTLASLWEMLKTLPPPQKPARLIKYGDTFYMMAEQESFAFMDIEEEPELDKYADALGIKMRNYISSTVYSYPPHIITNTDGGGSIPEPPPPIAKTPAELAREAQRSGRANRQVDL